MGLQNLIQPQKVLIEKEKFFFKKFKETKKAFFTRKNALFYFYTLYYIRICKSKTYLILKNIFNRVQN